MTKKPFSMRFDPHLVALADALAKERGIDRTAVFSLAVLAYVSHPKRAPSEVGEKIVDAVISNSTPKGRPRDRGNKDSKPKPHKGKGAAAAKPVDEFGDAPAVNVQKLNIAGWRDNKRPTGLKTDRKVKAR